MASRERQRPEFRATPVADAPGSPETENNPTFSARSVSMPPMFTFDPADHAPAFAAQEYVHIPNGLTEEYYAVVCGQVEEYLRTRLMKNFAIGDKQQALYQFPDGGDHVGQ